MDWIVRPAPGAVKVVFVHTYDRFRFGRWERVRSHHRSLPRT
jgi:hypothetical protein